MSASDFKWYKSIAGKEFPFKLQVLWCVSHWNHCLWGTECCLVCFRYNTNNPSNLIFIVALSLSGSMLCAPTQPSPWESTIRLSRPWGIPLIVSLLVDLGALNEHFSTFNEANMEKYKTLHCDCVISIIVYFRCLSLGSNALKCLEHRSVQNSISIPFRSHLERQPEIKGLEEFHLENKDTKTWGKTTTKHRFF